MSIELKGLEDILKGLESMGDMEGINLALGKACALVERSAKQKAPKKEGTLRNSIKSYVDNGVGVVYTPLEYAPYVEYGTGLYAEEGGRKDVPWAFEDEETGELIWTAGQHPQPFMRPALNENRQEILRILKEGIQND